MSCFRRIVPVQCDSLDFPRVVKSEFSAMLSRTAVGRQTDRRARSVNPTTRRGILELSRQRRNARRRCRRAHYYVYVAVATGGGGVPRGRRRRLRGSPTALSRVRPSPLETRKIRHRRGARRRSCRRAVFPVTSFRFLFL